jgi:hypothetical protein
MNTAKDCLRAYVTLKSLRDINPQMKILTPDEIECLLGLKSTGLHPLDILGYGYSSEGVRKFRAEQPDFFPQIAAHVQAALNKTRIFPADTNPDDPGYRTFIHAEGAAFKVNSAEEVGLSRFARISTGPLSEADALQKYIERVVNPDYVHRKEEH